MDNEQRAVDRIDTEQAVDLLQRMVRTPSITGEEEAIARLLGHELADIGFEDVTVSEFAPGRLNVTGALSGGPGPGLMMLGHTDTVHVEGWRDEWAGTDLEDPFSGHIVNGHIYGRGVGDQKAGIAAVLSACRAIRVAGMRPEGYIAVAFVGDEESGQPESGYSDGIKEVAERIRSGAFPSADFAIYTEPTTLKIYAAQMGFLTADIVVQGESAYFGTPWLGNDAIRAAHRLLEELYAYTDKLWDTANHPLVGRPFNLVTGIDGGGYIAVPGKCTVTIIRKLLPHESLDDAKEQIDSISDRVAIKEGVRIETTYTAPRDHPVGGTPLEADLEHSGLVALSDVLKEVTAEEQIIEGAPYWSEAPILKSLGIPTVYCAPGDITNCHTLKERVSIAQYEQSLEVYVRFISRYCGLQTG